MSLKFPSKGICECCREGKNQRTKKEIGKKFFLLCDECIASLKFTQACLRSGTDKILETMPERFRRVSQFSVTSI
jgi:hypothetical protein